MKKVLYYGMTGEKMCFNHILLNALDLNESGIEAKIIFEGASVKLIPIFEKENNPIYNKAKAAGLIAGFCVACSKVMEVYDDCVKAGIPELSDMNGHAGMKKYIQEDYEVVSM